MRYVNLPGIGGSNERHWQSLWEQDDQSFQRIVVPDWNKPDLLEWLRAVEAAVSGTEEECVLVAHSLSCLLAAEFVVQNPNGVAGLFLVAPPDPTSEPFPRQRAQEFIEIGSMPLDCPSVVLASSNDPYGTVEYARTRASTWRAELIELGPYGHINDLGAWSEGRQLFGEFVAGLSTIRSCHHIEKCYET